MNSHVKLFIEKYLKSRKQRHYDSVFSCDIGLRVTPLVMRSFIALNELEIDHKSSI